MSKPLFSALASAALVFAAMGCEVNIENPGVGGDAGASNNGNSNNGVSNNNGDSNNGQASNNGASNNGASNNGASNNGASNNGGSNNLTANDSYPCEGDPDIPKDQCQGGAEWDAYEGDQALIDRGQYLVRHVAACVDCHNPATPDFVPLAECESWWSIRDCTKELAGWNFPFVDEAPEIEGLGNIGFPNLTPHPDGLGEWSPEDLRTAFTRGVRPEFVTERPRVMWPLMPYWNFRHFTEEDQNAIIAYLHSLPPIPSGAFPGAGPSNREPQPEDSPFRPLDLAEPSDRDGDGKIDGIAPVPDDFMPEVTLAEGDPDYDRAVEGKYLAQFACSLCHTPAYAPDAGLTPENILENYTWVAHDQANCGSDPGAALMWSSWWPGMIFGPTLPGEIHAQNITGHMTFGVGDWTVDELTRSVNGIDKANEPMCPPMYVDTWFAPLTDRDKESIAIYLKNSEPCDNNTEGMSFDCKLPAN